MSRKGHYHGGSTSIGPRNASWFKKGSTRVSPDNSAPQPSRPRAEQAAFDEFKRSRTSGSKLIKASDKKKRPIERTRPNKKKLPGILAEPSIIQESPITHQSIHKKQRRVRVEIVRKWPQSN